MEFQRLQIYVYYVLNILFQDASTGVIYFMLRFKMADLQLFFHWLLHAFHYFTCYEREFQRFQAYVIKDIFQEASAGPN